MADLDAVMARLRATADALQPQPAVPAAPPVAVAVISVPRPCSWTFVIQRDDQGRVAAMTAEPIVE